MAVDKANAVGCSLNVYIERLIRADNLDEAALAQKLTLEPVQPQLGDEPETIEQPVEALDQIGADEYKRFDASCSNGTYHWRHSPGNPCKRCGGEI